eukprot:gene39769-48419_t
MMVQSLEWGCDEHLERLRNSTFEVLIAFAHRPSEDHLPENDMEFIARLESELSLKACLVSKSSVYKDAIELEYPESLQFGVEC